MRPMRSAQALRGSNLFLAFLGGLVALGPLSIDAYMPVMPDMALHFNVDMVAVNLTITAYVFGGALGQFFAGALSDHIGRRPLGLIGLLIFAAASLAVAVAARIEQVWTLRALQALGAGTASVICIAQLRDIYRPEEVGRKIANVTLVMLVAPMAAPMIGAALAQLGWASVFHFLTIYGFLYLLIYFFYVPETGVSERRAVTLGSLMNSYGAVLRHRVGGRRIAQRVMLFSACGAGIFMSYLTNAAYIYMEHFQLSAFQFAAAFGAGGLAIIVGNRSAVRLMGKFPPARILRAANALHLGAILAALAGALLFPNSLSVAISALLAIVGVGGAIAPSASGYFIGLFEQDVGSAASLSATFVFMVGAAFGALAALLSGGGLAPIFLVMLAAGLLARWALPRHAPSVADPPCPARPQRRA